MKIPDPPDRYPSVTGEIWQDGWAAGYADSRSVDPVAWRKPNHEWSCWDFTSEIPEDDPDGWEPLYLGGSDRG